MNKKKSENIKSEKTKKAPEMVASMFNWITPDIQRITAEKLDKATKK